MLETILIQLSRCMLQTPVRASCLQAVAQGPVMATPCFVVRAPYLPLLLLESQNASVDHSLAFYKSVWQCGEGYTQNVGKRNIVFDANIERGSKAKRLVF